MHLLVDICWCMKIGLGSKYLPFQMIDQRVACFYMAVSILSGRLRCKKNSLEKEEYNRNNRATESLF